MASFSDATNNINYDAPKKVNSTHSELPNLMSNISRHPQIERVYKRKRVEYDFRLLMLLEQKNTVYMKDIVQKVTEPGNLVLDACAGTFPYLRLAFFSPSIEDL